MHFVARPVLPHKGETIMPPTISSRVSSERRFIVGAAAAVTALVWTHALAAVLRHLGPDPSPAAVPLTVGAILVGVVASLVATGWRVRSALTASTASGLVAAGCIEMLQPGAGVAALALAVVAPAVALGARELAPRLPRSVDGARLRRPAVAALWALLAIASVIQVGRLATHVTDPETAGWFLSTQHPFWARHECLNAYVYGAELAARGEENLYDASHYPGLDPGAEPRTEVTGLVPEDPYQYPPQFLLLPSLALTATHDYVTIRVVWFALQATLFVSVALALALWVGRSEGRLAAWLVPLALIAFPTLHSLQYGQFHVSAIALSIAALLAFDRRRSALGGALLAAAVLAKLFPGLLVVALVGRRRWRDLAWTGAMAVVLTVVCFAVLGSAPFAAFVDYQLPRLADGSAFAFDQAWPEIRDLIVADNQGVRGLVIKLGALGLPGFDEATARTATRLFGLAALALAALFGWWEGRLSRLERATCWLALLGLASLASGGAWGDYVPLTATWLLTFLAGRLRTWSWPAAALGITWVFQFTLLGTTPIGAWAPPAVMIPLSAVGAVTLFALFGGTLGRALAEPGAAQARCAAGLHRASDELALGGARSHSAVEG
jgi:hypothetical protein